MLLPFDWAVLTVAEAEKLVSFIQVATATPKNPKNYGKMQEMEVFDLYNKLVDLVDASRQYHGELKTFSQSDFAKDDHEHDGFRAYH